MVELHAFESSKIPARYSRIELEDNFDALWKQNYSFFSWEIDRSGKTKVSVNEANKENLTKLMRRLICFFYNKHCFLLGFSEYLKKFNHLMKEAKIQETSISDTLLLIEEKIKANEADLEIYEKEYSGLDEEEYLKADDDDWANIFTFTNVEAEKKIFGKKAKFAKRKIFLEKSIELSKNRLKKLTASRDNLIESSKEILNYLSNDFAEINKSLENGHKLKSQFTSIFSIKDIIFHSELHDDLVLFIKGLEGLDLVSLKAQDALSSLKNQENTVKMNFKDDLYKNLIDTYQNLEVYKMLKPVYDKDRENLIIEESNLYAFVTEHSELWLLKCFQKNLGIITNDINKIISMFDNVRIKTASGLSCGIYSVCIAGKDELETSMLTLAEIKEDIINTQDQRIILNCILTLFTNLKRLFDTGNSLKLETCSRIIYKRNELIAISIKKEDFLLDRFREDYIRLIERCKMIESVMNVINESFKEFGIMANTSMIRDQKYAREYNQYSHQFVGHTVSERKFGWVSAEIVSPKLKRLKNNRFLIASNKEYKVTRNKQLETLNKIKETVAKLDYPEDLKLEIESLEYLIEADDTSNEIFTVFNTKELKIIRMNLLDIFDIDNSVIKNNIIAITLGGILLNVSLRQPRLFKIHDKKLGKVNQITIKDFCDKVLKEAKLSGKCGGKNMKSDSLFDYDFVSVDSFVSAIISEEVIGCVLTSSGDPQTINNEKVDENYENGLFGIAKNIATVLLSTKQEFIHESEIVEKLQKFRNNCIRNRINIS